MKRALFVLGLGLLLAQGGFPVGSGSLCLMAAQEQHTPPGHWCQRAMPRMSKNAHACACHQASCSDDDPNHLPAHTDKECKNYCHTGDCRCPRQDCP